MTPARPYVACVLPACLFACGARSDLDFYSLPGQDASRPGRDAVSSGAPDGLPPRPDASEVLPPLADATIRPGARDASDGPPGMRTSCGVALQAGSPWPMAQYCQTLRGQAPAIGPSTASIRWSQPSVGELIYQPAIAADGTVYFVDIGVTAYHADGMEAWMWNDCAGVVGTPTLLADGTIVVGCARDQRLYAVTPAGFLAWRSDPAPGLGNEFGSALPVASDGTLYSTASTSLTAVRPGGKIAWTVTGPASADAFSSPAIGPDGTVYVGGGGAAVTAYSPDGSMKWTFMQGNSTRGVVVADDGTLYFAADESLYAVDATGTLKWVFGVAALTTPALASDGTVYVVGGEGALYAVNPDGSSKWQTTLPFTGSLTFYGISVDGAGAAYVGTDQNGLIAVQADGTIAWVLPTSGIVIPPAIGADGTLYAAFGGSEVAIGP